MKEVKEEEEEDGGVSITTGATTGSVATSGEAVRVRRRGELAAMAEEGAEGVWILGKSRLRWARLCARRTSCPSAATTFGS